MAQGLHWLYENTEVLRGRDTGEGGLSADRERAAGDGRPCAPALSSLTPGRACARRITPLTLISRSLRLVPERIHVRERSLRRRNAAAGDLAFDEAKAASNLALVLRTAASGSTPTWRARLATANRRSPVSVRDRGAGLRVERGFDFGRFFADFVEHKPHVVPVEADGRCLVLQFHGAGQTGQGNRNVAEETLASRAALLRPSPAP